MSGKTADPRTSARAARPLNSKFCKIESQGMTDQELIEWLRANSSGVYRPAAEAADRLEALTRPETTTFEEFIPPTGKYPEDVVVHNRTRNEFHPLGGGMVRKVTAAFHEQFRRVSAADRGATAWRRAWFEIDGIPGRFPGYTCGKLWNGWACPAFQEGAAHAVLKSVKGPDVNEDTFTWRFDPRTASFYHKHIESGCDEETCESPIHIEVDGSTERVYPIGAQQWCWDECADEETEH